MKPGRCVRRWALALGAVGFGLSVAQAQTLRFEEYREMQIPDYANIRVGPFYSDWAMALSAGYRYTTSRGVGAPLLYDYGRGRLRKDGSEFPMMANLSMRNYLLISRYLDLDMSVQFRFNYFPMRTEDDEFAVEMTDLGFMARMGAFSFTLTEETWWAAYNGERATAFAGERAAGFAANLSTEFYPTPFVRGRLYDAPSYRVDYVDDRGLTDQLSGEKYAVFQNILGLDADWLMAKNKNLALSASATWSKPQNDDDDKRTARFAETWVYRAGLAYQQQLNPLAMAGARADYTWRDFLDRRGDQFQQDYLGFTSLQLTEASALEARLGYSLAELTDARLFETNGTSETVIGGAVLRTRLSDTLSHSLGYTRGQRAGFDAGLEIFDEYRYAISWAAHGASLSFLSALRDVETRLAAVSGYRDWLNQLGLSVPVARNTTLLASTAYTLRDNEPVAAGAFGEGILWIENDYDTWVSSVGLHHALSQHFTLLLYGEHVERFSDNPSLEFARDTVGVTLSYQHDF